MNPLINSLSQELMRVVGIGQHIPQGIVGLAMYDPVFFHRLLECGVCKSDVVQQWPPISVDLEAYEKW